MYNNSIEKWVKVALLPQKDATVELFVYQKVNSKTNKRMAYWSFFIPFFESIYTKKSENRGGESEKIRLMCRCMECHSV